MYVPFIMCSKIKDIKFKVIKVMYRILVQVSVRSFVISQVIIKNYFHEWQYFFMITIYGKYHDVICLCIDVTCHDENWSDIKTITCERNQICRTF